MLKPRCRSVFQNYQHFQAWQNASQYQCPNLLQRLNTNLNTYQNKYKKYMNFQQNQIKNSKKIQSFLPPLQKHQQNLPILTSVKAQIQSIAKSQNLTTQKVFISQQKQLKNSDIFCQRNNLLLRHKTLCFDKSIKQSNSFNRRKFSGNESKYPQIQKILIQSNKKEQASLSDSMILKEPLTKYAEGYKKLRYRLKKAANKSKLYHEQKNDIFKNKQNCENLFLKKRPRKVRQLIQQNIQQPVEQRTNEFSDKKFYQLNIKERYNLQR